MLERTKQQQTSGGGGLFGESMFDGQEFALPPSRKKPADDLFLLRTEKEVFNVALSFHPFDGLYARCRAKYNFISAVNVENFGEFRICAMVVGMNKGMRGGYFLQIEDISGQMELYLQEKVELEPFEIIYITGYKGPRAAKIDTIRVLSLASLRKKATQAKLYDPSQTVAQVRKVRKGELVITAPIMKPEMKVDPDPTADPAESPVEQPQSMIDLNRTYTFSTPENMLILAKVPHLLKDHPGEIPVTIGALKASISEE